MVWISNKSHHHLDRKYYAKVFMQKYVCSSLLCLLSFMSKPASILSDKRWGTLESHCKTFLSKGTSCWIRMVESNFEVRTCRMRGSIVAHPRFPAGPLAPVPIDIQQYWRHMFARSPSAAVRTRTLRSGADNVGSAFSHFPGSLCCWHSIRKSNKKCLAANALILLL